MGELFNAERILGFCEKVCYFFVINLLFLISNLPVLLFLLFAGAGQIRKCLPLFLLCMVPAAPALSAVMYAMNRLIHGTQRSAPKDYGRGYKSDFLQKIKLGAGQMAAVFVLWTNTEFFAWQRKSLIPAVLFFVMTAAAVLITPNLYMLASRYQMGNMQIVKTAAAIFLAKPAFTLGNTAALGLVLAAFEIAAGTAVLFMGSVYGFLVMYMNQGIMRKLESGSGIG